MAEGRRAGSAGAEIGVVVADIEMHSLVAANVSVVAETAVDSQPAGAHDIETDSHEEALANVQVEVHSEAVGKAVLATAYNQSLHLTADRENWTYLMMLII